MTVKQLLQERLEALDRSPAELAAAARVPPKYIEDLLAGRRQPPLPNRTDVYKPMTSFLKLSRNELAECASAEREASAPEVAAAPTARVRRMLLELCAPETARKLGRRRSAAAAAELVGFFQRLLDVTQVAVQRVLSDPATLRMSAERSGKSYEAVRVEVLDFLDTCPGTLTPDDVTRYVVPRVSHWDVEDGGVLRVVLRSQDTTAPDRRRGTTQFPAPHSLRQAD